MAWTMKRALIAGAIALTFTVGAGATSVQAAEVGVEMEFAPHAPPPRRHEIVPPPPHEHAEMVVWSRGRWQWNHDHWGWAPGRYIDRPRHEARWREGRWDRRPNGWIWVEGNWR